MTAANIPCKVKVTNYKKHKGSFSRLALDPEEFNGWTELSYKLLDQKGYRAEWLENKLDKEELVEDFEMNLIDQIEDYLEAIKEDYSMV